MAGIYLHIPFCKQLCHYCAFHKSISLKEKEDMMECLLRELELRREYLGGETIDTIYLGGGTPSLCSAYEIEMIIERIYQLFSVNEGAEITLEANPDDLTSNYLRFLTNSHINRLSVGIQSFHDDDLLLMNRRHTGNEGADSIKRAQDMGYNNISVDLIYGVPGLTKVKWVENLKRVFDLQIQHLSSYHLMFDPNTVFTHKLRDGKIKEIDEYESLDQYRLLIHSAKENGFVHYEISNFSLEGFYSRHNTNYWRQTKYLGIGPSAHSYNLETRQWNVSHNLKYINTIKQGNIPMEIEKLSKIDHYNDYVLTSLRTMWGLDLDYVMEHFGDEYFHFCYKLAQKYLSSDNIKLDNGRVILSDKGVFISNEIMSDFFWVEDE